MSTMIPSSRLYGRLGALPSDPKDPESIAELVVVAFGAFERYYVCWRNRAGQYRQDSYGLPAPLQEWLFSSTGQTRHFPTLQVVLGRDDEFFASDKDGKLENVNVDLRDRIPGVDSPVERTERTGLRRSRTLSFVRPSSDPAVKPFSPIIESPKSSPAPTTVPLRKRPQSVAFASAGFPQPLDQDKIPKRCGCSSTAQSYIKPRYVDTGVQTDPKPTIEPKPFGEEEMGTPTLSSRSRSSSVSEVTNPSSASSVASNPIVMGRMLDYFNAPKYQLGDALRSTYYHQPTYPDYGLYQTWRSVLDRRRTV
ncbi:hypothetical protein AOQ84DRAFT_371846 [Glonium stellatum]|uniref:Uncharacterized protein n=1 Tax=Glonium stellatum TaxID=574774 RepID=A0A8E2JY08_9PEZI|nr:hypothetical protein AOQ84DRAFT_371846 [Glonium stellatum]